VAIALLVEPALDLIDAAANETTDPNNRTVSRPGCVTGRS